MSESQNEQISAIDVESEALTPSEQQVESMTDDKKNEKKADLMGVMDKLTVLTDNQVTDKVKESANQIWLAGLGAYAKAEKEGTKLFDVLVKDGERLENKTRDFVDRQLNIAKDQVNAAVGKVDEVRAKATGSWGKVEKAFDTRVSNALHRLDIPTQLDFDEVTERIERLGDKVKKLAAERKIPFNDKGGRSE
ncbi:MAG: phasin family protein [Pseudomonadales bacterium]|nr:phasin family protein [Pseudomonadales bacterium]